MKAIIPHKVTVERDGDTTATFILNKKGKIMLSSITKYGGGTIPLKSSGIIQGMKKEAEDIFNAFMGQHSKKQLKRERKDKQLPIFS